jgi:DNA polymerase/3'-5' exonuclease PolX
MENVVIARRLREYAQYLEQEGDNLYRVRAYRRGAAVVEGLACPVACLVKEKGRKGLEALPGIGRHLSYTLVELLRTGEFHTVRTPQEFIAPERLAGCLPVARSA